MAKSPDHPELNFVQASGYTRGRPDGPPLWIVIHDMEAGESSDRAENTAAYFASGAGGRGVSSHYCADDNSVIQCVRLSDSAWCVGNRKGNNRGIQWEFSGFARQTRAQWLDEFGLAMFGQAAPYIRKDAERFGIPLRRCTIPDLAAMRPGVTSHNDLRLAFGGTTHTDPGAAFPWDVFMQILAGGPKQEDDAVAIAYKVESEDKKYSGRYYLSNGVNRRGPIRAPRNIIGPARAGTVEVVLTDEMRISVNAAVTWEQYLDAVAGPEVMASPDKLAAAVVAALPAGALTKGDVEAAVRAAFEHGLAPDGP
jgi:hypothetical protein